MRARRRSALRLAFAAITLALASAAGATVASASSKLLFGFTDNAPLSVGTKATAPALALGARGFAYFLLWAPGKSGLTQSDTTGLARAIAASGGARVIVVLRTEGANTPLTDVAQQQFCNYARSAIRTFPTVNDVVIGNEANAPFFWRPQFKPDDSPASASAAYEACARCLRRLRLSAPYNVAAPGTARTGNDNPNAVNNVSNSPTRFIRELAAAYRASGRTQRIFDTVVHHPYGDTNDERPYAMHPGPYFVGEGDWNKLVATYATHSQARRKRCRARLPPAPCVPIWYLEAGFQTSVRPGLYFGSENVNVVPDLGPAEPLSPSPLVTSSAPDQATQLRRAAARVLPAVRRGGLQLSDQGRSELAGLPVGHPLGGLASERLVQRTRQGRRRRPVRQRLMRRTEPAHLGVCAGSGRAAARSFALGSVFERNRRLRLPHLPERERDRDGAGAVVRRHRDCAADGYAYTVRGFDAAGQTGDASSKPSSRRRPSPRLRRGAPAAPTSVGR